ncbi:MAG: DNA recombination protein RmuC [Marinobacterium sp.]
MELLVAFGFILVVLLLGYLWHRSSQARVRAEMSRLQMQLESQLASKESLLAVSETRLSELKGDLEEEKQLANQLRNQLMILGEDKARRDTELEQKELHFSQQIKQLEESRTLLKREFEALAQEILEAKGKSFQEQSQQRLDALLKPMTSEMKGFKERIEKIHQFDNEQRSKLTTELQQLKDLNAKITTEAERLSSALQGQKKMQGNWGELMLENVLDSSGLRRDKDYKREVSINTEEGRQRPDVVVYLPQNKHLIIDAKTSLSAYTRYVNAEDPHERAQAIKEHAEAMQARIKELSDKSYFKLNGLNSPEVVVMFVPIESAYVEALKYNETLFQEAIEKQVLVATPTTLLTALNIVRQLWRFEDQSKHSAQLADRAEKVYSKLSSFLVSMQDVGRKLDSARTSYDKALGQLYSGKGNLIKQAAEFKELGVSVQKELPAELVEKASLELESPYASGASEKPYSAGIESQENSD